MSRLNKDGQDRDKKHYDLNKEDRLGSSRRYYNKNREKILAYKKETYVYKKCSNTEAIRERDLIRKYGINTKIYNVMFKEQGGCCSICLIPPLENKKLVVDHDHETGIVRGLLCKDCNSGLGFLKDNVEQIQRAADYLKKFGK